MSLPVSDSNLGEGCQWSSGRRERPQCARPQGPTPLGPVQKAPGPSAKGPSGPSTPWGSGRTAAFGFANQGPRGPHGQRTHGEPLCVEAWTGHLGLCPHGQRTHGGPHAPLSPILLGIGACQGWLLAGPKAPCLGRDWTKGSRQALYAEAKKYIPGGTQLLSKRPEMFLPEQFHLSLINNS